MKFKYNYFEKKLWRIKEDYFYEISEENRQIKIIPYIGKRIRFSLGQNHYLFLKDDDELGTRMTVCYVKPLENGEFVHYEKKLTPGWFQIETTFEFTEQDQVIKNTKGHWTPQQS